MHETERILQSMYTGKKILPKKVYPTKDQVASLQEMICKIVNVKAFDITSKSRKTELVKARQLLSCSLRLFTLLSLKKIGIIINRDHASVLCNIRTAKNLYETEIPYRDNYQDIIDKAREIFTRNMLLSEAWSEKITDINNFINNLVVSSNEYTREDIDKSLKESELFVKDVHNLMTMVIRFNNSLHKRETLIRQLEEQKEEVDVL